MSYMTDRKRADRWGSAKTGTQHFWRVKVQSVALLVLIPLFLIVVAPAIGGTYEEVIAHLGRPWPAIIAARVSPINIDELHVGQDVLLRLTSLSQRDTPEIYGEVVNISADAFVDEVSRQPYYRAEIVLRPGEVSKLPEDTVLIPGMPVEAFIQTEDRSPLAYLMKPLADYFARAFRES